MGDKQAVLEGTVERITFRNDENGYTVLRLRPDEDERAALKALPVTVVGHFAALSVGERLRVWGSWVHHPQYGRQLSVADFTVVAPETLEGIRRYLGSGLIHGIGPAFAERLVNHFGENTLHVIEHEPERLREVEGIGPKRAEAVAAGLKQQKAIQQVMVFLQGYGISTAYATRIYRVYGDGAVQTVRDNPYRLAQDVPGIGFTIADKIARSIGIAHDAPERLMAGIEYTLEDAAGRGHVLLTQAELLEQAAETLQLQVGAGESVESRLQPMVDGLVARRRVVQEAGDGGGDGGDDGDVLLYTPRLHRAETGLAAGLKRLLRSFMPLRVVGQDGLSGGVGSNTDAVVAESEKRTGLALSDEQREAVVSALDGGVFVLTGGPGTGKTTILRTLLACLEADGQRVELACPTGRAAQRLREATGRPAKTIHRLLEFGLVSGEGFRFQRNEQQPLTADTIIIDEASMVDLPLAYQLVRAVPDGARLILVGDVEQLPPVGPGYPLRDIIDSGVVPVARLTKVFRQAEQSLIVSNAHRMLRHEPLVLNRADGDFFFIECDDNDAVAETVRDLAVRRVPGFIEGDPVEDVQVLSPMRRSVTGVEYLNEVLQLALNPPSPGKPELRVGPLRLRQGDKVMQIRNNYDKGIFNGDVGRIRAVDEDEGTIVVRFPQPEGVQTVEYGSADADELVLAYCITVHKSQGSEYPAVIMPLTTQHYIMLQRHLLYTAVTRARQIVVIVGSRGALQMALDGLQEESRAGRLAERLREA